MLGKVPHSRGFASRCQGQGLESDAVRAQGKHPGPIKGAHASPRTLLGVLRHHLPNKAEPLQKTHIRSQSNPPPGFAAEQVVAAQSNRSLRSLSPLPPIKNMSAQFPSRGLLKGALAEPVMAKRMEADPSNLEERVLGLERLVAEKERQHALNVVQRDEEEARASCTFVEQVAWSSSIAWPMVRLTCGHDEARVRRAICHLEVLSWDELEQMHDRQRASLLQQHMVRRAEWLKQQKTLMDAECISRWSLEAQLQQELRTAMIAVVAKQELVGRLALEDTKFQLLTTLAAKKATTENSHRFQRMKAAVWLSRLADLEAEEEERREKTVRLIHVAFTKLLLGVVVIQEELQRGIVEDAPEGVLEESCMAWVEPEEAVHRHAILNSQSANWAALCRRRSASKVAVVTQARCAQGCRMVQRFARAFIATTVVRKQRHHQHSRLKLLSHNVVAQSTASYPPEGSLGLSANGWIRPTAINTQPMPTPSYSLPLAPWNLPKGCPPTMTSTCSQEPLVLGREMPQNVPPLPAVPQPSPKLPLQPLSYVVEDVEIADQADKASEQVPTIPLAADCPSPAHSTPSPPNAKQQGCVQSPKKAVGLRGIFQRLRGTT